jgi:hypothetical protein
MKGLMSAFIFLGFRKKKYKKKKKKKKKKGKEQLIEIRKLVIKKT